MISDKHDFLHQKRKGNTLTCSCCKHVKEVPPFCTEYEYMRVLQLSGWSTIGVPYFLGIEEQTLCDTCNSLSHHPYFDKKTNADMVVMLYLIHEDISLQKT